jgi:hypothetical protein
MSYSVNAEDGEAIRVARTQNRGYETRSCMVAYDTCMG